ncbi:unnamed protein product [Dovyalis caffra]|uniref:Uncharacterized protein n=1 Tax=Dovyalis caffra TaxID=77055 RepID=A0AAV1R5A5_9ROSI|nr:unnamed protein product [Dovyalis caffra]
MQGVGVGSVEGALQELKVPMRRIDHYLPIVFYPPRGGNRRSLSSLLASSNINSPSILFLVTPPIAPTMRFDGIGHDLKCYSKYQRKRQRYWVAAASIVFSERRGEDIISCKNGDLKDRAATKASMLRENVDAKSPPE